jgi:hypothetical protein
MRLRPGKVKIVRKLLVVLCVVFSLPCFSFAAESAATKSTEPSAPRQLPRYFEANRGQWPSSQAFRAYGYGYGVALNTHGVTLQVASPSAIAAHQKRGGARPGNIAPPQELSLRFEGSSDSAVFMGKGQLAAKGAWFQGRESDWKSNIPLFDSVEIAGLYSGVDAAFYGRDGQLEYDLNLAPRAADRDNYQCRNATRCLRPGFYLCAVQRCLELQQPHSSGELLPSAGRLSA